MFQNLTSNPLFQQAQKMAEGRSEDEILAIAKNICSSKGIDFQDAYAKFQQFMKGVQ
jgi:hypothetical protein